MIFSITQTPFIASHSLKFSQLSIENINPLAHIPIVNTIFGMAVTGHSFKMDLSSGCCKTNMVKPLDHLPNA
jgi:hypothetical protein